MANDTLILLTVLCIIGAGLGIYVIYLLTVNDAPKADRKSESTKRERTTRPKTAKSNSKGKIARNVTESGATWVDVTEAPAQLGQAKVSVIRAFAGPLPGVPGATEYLYIQLRVRNMDRDKPLTVGRWEKWAGRSIRQDATISDKENTIFARANPFRKTIVVDKMTLKPGERFDQFLVFERPPKSVKRLRLLLDGSAVGVPEESFRLLVPSPMISEATEEDLARLFGSLPPEYRPGGEHANPTPAPDSGDVTDDESDSGVTDAVDIRPTP